MVHWKIKNTIISNRKILISGTIMAHFYKKIMEYNEIKGGSLLKGDF